MSQPPNRPPVAPWLPPEFPVSPTRHVPRAGVGFRKGAWIAGLICALLPVLSVAVIFILAVSYRDYDPENELMERVGLSIVSASAWIIRCTVFFAGIAVL